MVAEESTCDCRQKEQTIRTFTEWAKPNNGNSSV